MTRAEFTVGGMTCSHCVAAVRKALDAIEGIEAQDVRIGMVRIDFDPGLTSANKVIAAIAAEGYDVSVR